METNANKVCGLEKKFEQMSDSSYVGSVISECGEPDRELSNRTCEARKICSQLYIWTFTTEV